MDTTLSSCIQEPFVSSWEYFDSQKKKYFLKYEIVCSIGNSRIVWFDGPWKSTVQDCTLSRRSQLRCMLTPGERLLADKGYIHSPYHFICPVTGVSTILDPEDRTRNYMIYSARQSVERLLCRLKKWGFWTVPWRASLGLHSLCARVVAKLVSFHLLFEPLG